MLALVFGPEWLFERLLKDVDTISSFFLLFFFWACFRLCLFLPGLSSQLLIARELAYQVTWSIPDAKGLHLICPAIVRFAPGTMLVSS